MKFSKSNVFNGCVVWLTLMLSPVGVANETPAQEHDPYQKIEYVTAKLLKIISEHQQGYPANETGYFQALHVLLDTVVDFKFIIRLYTDMIFSDI
mgnify:CR=1 FL=1